jgi:hypothetical protein
MNDYYLFQKLILLFIIYNYMQNIIATKLNGEDIFIC